MIAARERYRQQLRAAILDAARDLFLREGYGSFSMRKLAATLRCSHGNLYLYFSNKQQIFDCLVEESFAQLSGALAHLKHADHEKDPIGLLKEASRLYIEFGRRNPSVYEFAFVLRRTGPVGPWKPHAAAFGFLRNAIKRCIEEKVFRPIDVDIATQAMWAAVHGVTSLLISRPRFPWVEANDLISCVIDSSIAGLLRSSPSRPVSVTGARSPRSRKSSRARGKLIRSAR